MARKLLLLLAFALVGAAQGCRICDSPYDYCGPVMPCDGGCGAGGCGHGGYDGGYADAGYSGGQGGCSTCNGGSGQGVEYSHEHASPVMQGQPVLAPETMQQGRRPSSKSVMKPTTKASYERPAQTVRQQPATMQARPAKMSPYPMPGNGNRMASGDSGRGVIFW
jgi:hypothetical protein